MARPRKSDEDQSAIQKTETAFWKLLEEHPYQELTVMMVVQEAKINRNSFYYHYENINDLAKKAFANTIGTELSRNLIRELVSHSSDTGEMTAFSPISETLPHVRKIMLCARSQSPMLHNLVKELISDVWFSALSINKNKLSKAEQLEVDFIFSGLVALLGNESICKNPLLLVNLPETRIGRCAADTLKEISTRGESV